MRSRPAAKSAGATDAAKKLDNPAIQIVDSTGVSVNGVSVPEGVPAVGGWIDL